MRAWVVGLAVNVLGATETRSLLQYHFSPTIALLAMTAAS
jgi:hypothetical protein